MLRLTFLLAAALATAPGPFAPLAVYNGTWIVHAQHSFTGNPGPDTLINRCTTGTAFFTCEQIVNGKPTALVIFTLSKEPGKYDVDNVLPNGYASSNTDLYVAGDHWTFLTRAAKPGDKQYRTENIFKGPDAIHFEQFESTDDAKTWTKTNEGDESRQRP